MMAVRAHFELHPNIRVLDENVREFCCLIMNRLGELAAQCDPQTA